MKPMHLTAGAKATLILPIGLLAASLLIIGVQLLFERLLDSTSFGTFSPRLQEAGFILACFGSLALLASAGMALFGLRLPVGPKRSTALVAGISLGLAGLFITVSLVALAGTLTAGAEQDVLLLPLVAGLALTLLQSGAEELYCRGWMQPVLQEGWGRWPGLFATAAAFCVLHFVTGNFDPMSMGNLFLGGLFFGLLLDRSGSILVPIGAHFAWNAGEELLFGVFPNPGTGNFGAVQDWDLSGSALWGGSEAGLNASLSTSFALLALIAALGGWKRHVSPRFQPS